MKIRHQIVAALLTGLVLGHSGQARAAATTEVSYATLLGSSVDFNELATAPFDSVVIDGLLTSGGVQFGERFAGQELAVAKLPRPGAVAQDWFDDLSFGLPTAGLALLAGVVGGNLGAYHYGDADGAALFGLGPQAGNTDGFGAISARFAAPVAALGLQLRDDDGGAVMLNLYRTDGSLIEAVDLGGRSDGRYAFARSGGAADIAGFSLTNRDSYYGVSIDNLRLGSVAADVRALPEPGSFALLLAGFTAMGVVARSRKR